MALKKTNKAFKSKDIQLLGYNQIIIFILLLIADRITKIWAMSLSEPIDHGWIQFLYVTNTGAGFSLLTGMNTLFVFVSIFALMILFYYKKYIPQLPFLLIVAGICGNLMDRIFYESVIDFINLKWWPIFNIADSLIFIGVAWWIVVLVRDKE